MTPGRFKKLGLLDANNSWLRKRFEELGVIQFEDWADTEAEYEAFALAGTHGTKRSIQTARPTRTPPAGPSALDS